MRRIYKLSLAIAAAAGFAGLSIAADPPTTMFVVDGSGSMWGRFEPDKRAKIDVVRELLKPIVSTGGAAKTGLVSFGHRLKGNCNDVEIISPPVTERDPVLLPLEKLNPKGKGPLVEGLKQAVAAIGANRPASVVVIGDGADNCQQDACAASAEIAKSAPGIAVHVISIGVDPVDHPRLSCIAKQTGGQFYSVSDPVGLAAAISEASGHAPSVAGDRSSPQVAMRTTPEPVPAGSSLVASAALAEGKPLLSLPILWRVLKADGSAAIPATTSEKITAALEAGTYTIEADAGRVKAKKQVTIEAGKPISVIVPLDAARLIVRSKSKKDATAADGALITVSQTVGEANQVVWLGKFSASDLVLPPAAYSVLVSEGAARQHKNVTLATGTETISEFDFGTGRLELSASLTEGGELAKDVIFAISEDDPESTDGRRELTRSHAPAADFMLAAGTYYVSARSGGAEVQQRIALSSGDTLQKTLVLGATHLKLSATVGGGLPSRSQAIVYRVTTTDSGKREVAHGTGSELSTILNAGRYRVTASLAGQGVSASQDVTLEAGKPATLLLKLDGSEISFRPPAHASAAPGEVFWEIKDQAGKAIWHATAPEPKIFLAPGRYNVRVETRDKGTEASFEVKGGDSRQIELGTN